MKRPFFFLLFALLFATVAYSAKTVAVLEITPVDETVGLKIAEYRHLTDELRTRAREALPRDYTVLTRDNIISLMPPDAEQADCLAESCAVEIGRAIGAEYVTQGFVGHFGEMLTLTVELYESMSGNMLGSFVTESNSIMGLLGTVREKAPSMFANVKQDDEPKQSKNAVKSKAAKDAVKEAVKEPAGKSEGSGGLGLRGWTRVAAYALTAGFVGMAIYKHVDVEDNRDKLSKLDKSLPESEGEYDGWRKSYASSIDAAKSGEKQRLAYSIGAGASALAVALTFVF
ncbi:MAG: hypothetical protein FWC26_11980 [Fibromonadales bacterium]|nr:hypothetical protein [Fibromonadales bacterium]